jgi:hypothetical protein
MTQPQHLFIPADAGEKVTLPGIAITIKVTAASTGNAFAVFEEVTSPGAGPALHVHRNQFEIFRFLAYLPCPFWRKANNFRGLFVFLLYYVATINTAYIEQFP